MAAKTSPADWIALLIAQAKPLREAGVTSLTIDGVSVALSPWEPPAEKGGRVDEDGAIGALDDAATYGRREGVPGFTRPTGDDEGDF